MTASWAGTHASWSSSESEFMKIVSGGFPGRGMPGISHFTKEEWSELFSYVREISRVK